MRVSTETPFEIYFNPDSLNTLIEQSDQDSLIKQSHRDTLIKVVIMQCVRKEDC